MLEIINLFKTSPIFGVLLSVGTFFLGQILFNLSKAISD